MIAPLSNWDSEATLATFHNGEFEQWVLGRKTQKSRPDLLRYRKIIEQTRPEAIVETGTRWGGSAGWFAEVGQCPVISIDIDPLIGWTGRNRDQADRGITYLTGSSTSDDIVSFVEQRVKGRRILVSLDSDHHADHVSKEIAAYADLVGKGGVLVVEDACFDLWEGEDSRRGGRMIPEVGGPLKAIREWVPVEEDVQEPPVPAWVRMEKLEGMYAVSHSPCGWWQRR